MKDYQLLLCTCPTAPSAEQIAQLLVEQQLAACVNIVPQITSIYRWQNKIERTHEHLLLIKTKSAHYTQVEACIKSVHPYEVAEIIAINIAQGLPAYLAWIAETVIS